MSGGAATTSVRAVDGDELEALFRFRHAVLGAAGGGPDEAPAPAADGTVPDGRLRDELDDHATNFALFDGDRIVGSLRGVLFSDLPDGPLRQGLMARYELRPALEAFAPEAIALTSRFIIAPDHRPGSAVLDLMRAAFMDGLSRGVRLTYGHCSPHLLPFYEQLGYRRYTAGYNDTAQGFKMPVLMVTRDRACHSRVRSPFLRLIDESADDGAARDWFARHFPLYVDPPTAGLMAEDRFLEFLADRLAGDPAHHVNLLAGLAPDEQRRFLASATTLRVNPGDRVVRRGERDRTLFAILSGIAEVANPAKGPPLAVFGAGDTFGEIGFLAQVPRTADVIARTHGEFLVLTSDFFDRFRADHPDIAAKVLLNLSRELAGRLGEMNERVAAKG